MNVTVPLLSQKNSGDRRVIFLKKSELVFHFRIDGTYALPQNKEWDTSGVSKKSLSLVIDFFV